MKFLWENVPRQVQLVMISKESIRITITLNKALYLACRKHHLRVSKIVREAGEDALQEKLDRLNKKIK